MAADCEQTRVRMLELIYGELSAEARAGVEAHVAGCASCRAELRALESTRALARRTLAADQPPPRVHAAILRAAATARPTPERAAAAAPKAAPAAKPSAWAWLRGKWTLPTFATVGAVAVFLLASRIFLEPEKTYQRGREGLAPAEQAPREEAPPTAPAKEPTVEGEGPGAAAAAPAAANQAAPAAANQAAPAAANQAAPAAKPAAAPARRRRVAAPARVDEPTMKAERAELPPELAAPPPSAAPAPRASAPRAFAPPPSAARGQAFDRAADEDRTVPSEASDDGPSSAGAAPAGAAPRPRTHAAKKAEAPALEELAAPSGSAVPAPPGRSAGGHESPVARADRLFAEARWGEAAVAYLELLRDDPRNPQAPHWRRRWAACEEAAARAR